MRVNYSSSEHQSESATQTLMIEVVVKPPRYVLARAQRAADEFMGFHVEAHRSNLVDYYTEQRSDAQEGSWPPSLGLLMLRMVSPLHATDSDVLQAATTLHLRPANTAS
ncbi:unnamed protein product, partial [Dibothriocephalus latus]